MGRNRAAPVLDAPMGAPFAGVVALDVGGFHACARKAGGELFCWGKNDKGSVGDGTVMPRPNPVQVLVVDTFATGRFHTCATKADHTLWCWGEKIHSRLGTGDTGFQGMDVHAPAQTAITGPGGPPLGDVASVAAGASTCAVTTAGLALCWGNGAYGQTGTIGGTPYPADVLLDGAPLANVDRMFAHFTRTCAFLTDGNLLCWGRNTEGELGDGTFANHGTPVPLAVSCAP
jgi:alpha-tubulin suppressor-like RCC1 family protein